MGTTLFSLILNCPEFKTESYILKNCSALEGKLNCNCRGDLQTFLNMNQGRKSKQQCCPRMLGTRSSAIHLRAGKMCVPAQGWRIILPSSFCSNQVLSSLCAAHPHWQGQVSKLSLLHAKLFQRHPLRHTPERMVYQLSGYPLAQSS